MFLPFAMTLARLRDMAKNLFVLALVQGYDFILAIYMLASNISPYKAEE